MIRRLSLCIILLLLFTQSRAQHRFYKNPDIKTVQQFSDSANRVVNLDPNSLLRKQFDYILKFYPEMNLKYIQVKFNNSSLASDIKPTFASIFKLPAQRAYTIYFSKKTRTTLDSVLLHNLSFNAQLGMIANEISTIEDLSTGGFFNFLGFYFNRLTQRGRNRISRDAQLKTLEVGLGHQLLALNREIEEKLRIDNWTNTKGYTAYFKFYRNRYMRPAKVLNLMNDLPVYMSNSFK